MDFNIASRKDLLFEAEGQGRKYCTVKKYHSGINDPETLALTDKKAYSISSEMKPNLLDH